VAEVNGPDVAAMNSFAAPRVVDVRESTVEAPGGRLEHCFPAHSVSVLRFTVDGGGVAEARSS
jgi:hypothetical protein